MYLLLGPAEGEIAKGRKRCIIVDDFGISSERGIIGRKAMYCRKRKNVIQDTEALAKAKLLSPLVCCLPGVSRDPCGGDVTLGI